MGTAYSGDIRGGRLGSRLGPERDILPLVEWETLTMKPKVWFPYQEGMIDLLDDGCLGKDFHPDDSRHFVLLEDYETMEAKYQNVCRILNEYEADRAASSATRDLNE